MSSTLSKAIKNVQLRWVSTKLLKKLAFQVKHQRTFWKGVDAIVSSKLDWLQHNLLLNFASLFKHTPVFKTKTIIRQELVKCEQKSFLNANPAEELCLCLLMLLLKQSKLLHKRIALAKHEFCQNQLFPSSWSEDRRYDEESYCPEKTNNTFEKESWANNGEKPDMPQNLFNDDETSTTGRGIS